MRHWWLVGRLVILAVGFLLVAGCALLPGSDASGPALFSPQLEGPSAKGGEWTMTCPSQVVRGSTFVVTINFGSGVPLTGMHCVEVSLTADNAFVVKKPTTQYIAHVYRTDPKVVSFKVTATASPNVTGKVTATVKWSAQSSCGGTVIRQTQWSSVVTKTPWRVTLTTAPACMLKLVAPGVTFALYDANNEQIGSFVSDSSKPYSATYEVLPKAAYYTGESFCLCPSGAQNTPIRAKKTFNVTKGNQSFSL
jgi:hypothetical protein